jgi:hypothetical protein
MNQGGTVQQIRAMRECAAIPLMTHVCSGSYTDAACASAADAPCSVVNQPRL